MQDREEKELGSVLGAAIYTVAAVDHPQCRGVKLQGRLVYPDGAIDISSDQMNEAFKGQFRGAIALLSSSSPPHKVPSFRGCRYCNIPAYYCPERVEDQGART